MAERVNNCSDCSIGVVANEIYLPLIMWNISISEKDHPFKAYGCEVYLQGRNGEKKTFKVWIKEGDF